MTLCGTPQQEEPFKFLGCEEEGGREREREGGREEGGMSAMIVS